MNPSTGAAVSFRLSKNKQANSNIKPCVPSDHRPPGEGSILDRRQRRIQRGAEVKKQEVPRSATSKRYDYVSEGVYQAQRWAATRRHDRRGESGAPQEEYPRSFWEDISSPEEDDEGFAPRPHRLFQKADENFLCRIFDKTISLTS